MLRNVTLTFLVLGVSGALMAQQPLNDVAKSTAPVAATPGAQPQAVPTQVATPNPSPQAAPAGRKVIIIGFVGGFVSHDDAKHPEVQFAAYLRDRYRLIEAKVLRAQLGCCGDSHLRPSTRANGDSRRTHNPNRHDCQAWQQWIHHPSERSQRYQFLSGSRSTSWTFGNRRG
jgi:hypothetical protein